MPKYTWRMLFRDFRKRYPSLWRPGTTYKPYGFMTILVMIPKRGELIFEYFGNKITWLRHFEDDDKIRQMEKEKRQDYYEYFVDSVFEYMDETGYTQQDIADISGVSRKSINRYLSGKSIPKNSTMDKICRALDIEEF